MTNEEHAAVLEDIRKWYLHTSNEHTKEGSDETAEEFKRFAASCAIAAVALHEVKTLSTENAALKAECERLRAAIIQHVNTGLAMIESDLKKAME